MNSDAACFTDALARRQNLGLEDHIALGEQVDAADPEQEVIFAAPNKGPDATDEMLLARVRLGDRDALSLLFHRYARSVRNVAYRVLRDDGEADDLVQEVFLFIFRKAALYDPKHGRAATWLIHVAYHRAFDRRRYLKSHRFYASQELNDAGLSLKDHRKELPFHSRSIEGVLGKLGTAKFRSKLSPEQQETLQLFFFEGYVLKEIAELTGRSLVNVRSHYYRGLERLRKHLFPETMQQK